MLPGAPPAFQAASTGSRRPRCTPDHRSQAEQVGDALESRVPAERDRRSRRRLHQNHPYAASCRASAGSPSMCRRVDTNSTPRLIPLFGHVGPRYRVRLMLRLRRAARHSATVVRSRAKAVLTRRNQRVTALWRPGVQTHGCRNPISITVRKNSRCSVAPGVVRVSRTDAMAVGGGTEPWQTH